MYMLHYKNETFIVSIRILIRTYLVNKYCHFVFILLMQKNIIMLWLLESDKRA